MDALMGIETTGSLRGCAVLTGVAAARVAFLVTSAGTTDVQGATVAAAVEGAAAAVVLGGAALASRAGGCTAAGCVTDL